MKNDTDFYPPTPSDMPPDLAKPNASYRTRVVVVLTSLFLFALLYVGLVVASGYFCYWCFASVGGVDSSNDGDAYHLLRSASDNDTYISGVFNSAWQQLMQKQIDEQEFLKILEDDVLPPWRDQGRKLLQIDGLSPKEQELAGLLGASFQMQEESWQLLARAIREKNRAMFAKAQEKAKESEQLLQRYSADANSYFQSRSRSPSSGNSNGGYIIAGILLGILFLFLVKGFFKRRQRLDPTTQIEVTEKEQPILFAFIRRLCRDTRAPFPRHVYVTPDVNAAVFYDESFLNLFLPTSKNLIIGLGLVNQLNLTEFKAVLAHEFGHFSQNSMKLGSYVYMSNGIIGDLVYGRDWFDTMLAHGRATDIRIAVFAWGVTGIVWVLRKTMQGLFRVINFANSALSRQMEFNADLVAVSVTGSDALVHSLTRLNFANECLLQAWADLTAAADHNIYTCDLFYHQTQAAHYLRTKHKDPQIGKPPELPDGPNQASQVFQPEDTGAPKMWATHPSNYDRELNAKRLYIRSPIDERSPWILFENGSEIREQMTRILYRLAKRPENITFEQPEVVQGFIDEEHAETTYNPRYHGLYDHRYIKPGEMQELLNAVPADYADASKLAEAKANLYGDELETHMKAHQSRHEECNKLVPLAQGAVELTGKDFQFRGERYTAAEAKRLLDQIQKEMEEDFAWMHQLDRKVFLIHYAMAKQVDAQLATDMAARYRFHLQLQAIHDDLAAQNDQVQAALNHMANKPELSMEEFQGILSIMCEARHVLGDRLDDAKKIELPALKNLNAGDALGRFLLDRRLVRELRHNDDHLDANWIGEFLEQMGEVLDKCQRIHFKSLGAILALQELIDEKWETQVRGVSAAPINLEPRTQ